LENKAFFVFHPAFAYFASDYSMQMYSLEEEGKEANPNHMIKMIQLAKEKGAKVIFYQEEHASQEAQVFANEINGTAVSLAPLSPDFIPNLRLMAQTIANASK
jgi:zinc transport system substrate-binding protein